MSEQRGGDAVTEGDAVVSRVFDAPRELVFEVWTQAEHFARWFGPHGADVVDCELDARPGGVIRFGHRLPDLTLYVKGTFAEVVPDERLVYNFAFVDELGQPAQHPMFPEWPPDVLIEMVVVFEDAGHGTRVTVLHGVLPAAAAASPATKRWAPMALEGSRQVLERLGEHLARIA